MFSVSKVLDLPLVGLVSWYFADVFLLSCNCFGNDKNNNMVTGKTRGIFKRGANACFFPIGFSATYVTQIDECRHSEEERCKCLQIILSNNDREG